MITKKYKITQLNFSFFAQRFFILLGNLIIFINLFSLIINAQEITLNNQLKAQVYLDDIPPSIPVLRRPENNPGTFCQKQPLFSWSEANDNIGVNSYTFTLTGTTSNHDTPFNFSQTFSEATSTADYRVWSAADIWYLQLTSPLEWGNYSWQVGAADKENNQSEQQTRQFQLSEENCTFQCSRDSQLNQIDWQTPNASISTLRPAITFIYPENNQPTSLNLIVDGQTVLTNIDLTTTQKTSLYTTNLDPDKRKITIQTENDYLSKKTTSPSTWQVQFQVIDSHGCPYTSAIKTLTFSPTIICTDAALMPKLLEPKNQAIDTKNQLRTFSWSLCGSTNQFFNQSLTLNDRAFTGLGLTNLKNEDYSYQVSNNSYTSSCDSNQLNFSLTLHNLNFFKTNDPLDPDDWNRWFVTVTDCNNISLSSSTSRFRRYPQSSATYFWCSQTDHCQSGTLAECTATGKNCYYNDQSTCLEKATLDCSTQPPTKTYYWCQSPTECNAGTLTECEATGKNCYLIKDNPQGNGCLQQAATECSDQAQYFWCTSQLTCNLTDLATCSQAGKPCYRQAYLGQACPARTKSDCQPIITTALTQSPWGSLYNLNNNGLAFLQKIGVSENDLQKLEKIAILILPLISLCFLLPFNLLVLVLPIFKGRLYLKKNLFPLACALVKIEQNGQLIKQFFTDNHGLFPQFSLSPGTYQLKIAYSVFLLDDQEVEKSPVRLFSTSTNINQFHYQEMFTVKPALFNRKRTISNIGLMNNFIDQKLIKNSQKIKFRHRLAHIFHQLNRHLTFNLWSGAFFFTAIITWFYPSLLNVVIFSFYLLTFVYKTILTFYASLSLKQIRPFVDQKCNLKQISSKKT